MRLPLLVLTAMLVLAAPAQAAPRCEDARGRTIARSDQARAFVREGEIYTCRTGRRRIVRRGFSGGGFCGSSSGCGGIEQLRIAGRFVAYSDFECCGSYGDETFALVVADAGRRRTRTWRRFGEPAVEDARLVRVVLHRSGAAAWSFTRSRDDADPTAEVWRGGSCTPEAVDAGPALDPATLRRRGRSIAWRSGGERRSARICR